MTFQGYVIKWKFKWSEIFWALLSLFFFSLTFWMFDFSSKLNVALSFTNKLNFTFITFKTSSIQQTIDKLIVKRQMLVMKIQMKRLLSSYRTSWWSKNYWLFIHFLILPLSFQAKKWENCAKTFDYFPLKCANTLWIFSVEKLLSIFIQFEIDRVRRCFFLFYLLLLQNEFNFELSCARFWFLFMNGAWYNIISSQNVFIRFH